MISTTLLLPRQTDPASPKHSSLSVLIKRIFSERLPPKAVIGASQVTFWVVPPLHLEADLTPRNSGHGITCRCQLTFSNPIPSSLDRPIVGELDKEYSVLLYTGNGKHN